MEVPGHEAEQLASGGMLHPHVETLDQAWGQGGRDGDGRPVKVTLGDLDEDGVILVNEEPPFKEVAVEVLDEGVLPFGLVLVGPLPHLDEIPDPDVTSSIVMLRMLSQLSPMVCSSLAKRQSWHMSLRQGSGCREA